MPVYDLTTFKPEVQQKIRIKAQQLGIPDDKIRIVRFADDRVSLENADDLPGPLESVAKGFAQGIVPTVVGMAGAAGAGALTGFATKNPVAVGTAGLAGGVVTGAGASLAQNKVLSTVAPGIAESLELSRAVNPVASTLGEIASGFLVGGPGGIALTKEGLKKARSSKALQKSTNISLSWK